MRKSIILIGIILITLIAGCLETTKSDIPAEKYCEQDTDCFAGECCHPNFCVNQENIPDCEGVVCSLSCQGPLDCGAGSCGCVNNKCEVIPAEEQNE